MMRRSFIAYLSKRQNTRSKKPLDIANDHAFTSTQSTLVTNIYYFLDSVGNKFNDAIVQERLRH